MAKNDVSMKRIGVLNQYKNVNKADRNLAELAEARQQSIRGCFWGEVDPRRRQEWAEGGMVNEDNRAMANCPTRAIHTEYPKTSHGMVYTPDFAMKLFSTEED